MKKVLLLSAILSCCLFIGIINSCRKDSNKSAGISISFSEEFDSVYALESKGWVIKDNSEYFTMWVQPGSYNSGKVPAPTPFTAYSYVSSPYEYILASLTPSTSSYYSVSSWLITPVLSVKNGDKISFYTRADTGNVYKDRLQVLMNSSSSSDVGNSTTSVGGFTQNLFDINSGYAAGAYPTTWTKYEHTFSGISGKINTRIAFRYYVSAITSARTIGIDLFKFESN